MIFLWILFNISHVFGGCGTMTLTASNLNISWDESYTYESESLQVTKSTGGSCSYFVTFSAGGASSYASRRLTQSSLQLPYQLYKTSSLSTTDILNDLPSATTSNTIVNGSISGGAGSSSTKNYYFSIPSATATSPTLAKYGTYTDTFVMSVYEGTIESHAVSPDATSSITVTTVVPKILRISLVSSGGSFSSSDTTETLSFGTLTEGSSLGFDLKAVSNAGYSISVSSPNNGYLHHSTLGSSSSVSYVFQASSVTKDLSNSSSIPAEIANVSGTTSLSGATIPVMVTIGSVTDKVAGNYSDIILVTASTID